jgi:glycosyltransferase involved in cell wall biosynthesis
MGFPPQRRRDRLLRRLDGFYFRHFAAATVCISPECARQVEQVAGRPKGPRYQFIPQYYPDFLSRVKPVPLHSDRPFRILFLGRVEEFKGVFMILDMAERLEQEMPGQFAWKIIGSGSAEEELRRQAAARKLGSIVDIPGRFQDEATALATFGWAHAMIAPTTSQFFEGLAMVAAESILAGRPVIVSDVVPAWEVLGGAVIKCKTDSVSSFVEKIRRLATDAEYYAQHQRATADFQGQYYDAYGGLGNVLGRAILKLSSDDGDKS